MLGTREHCGKLMGRDRTTDPMSSLIYYETWFSIGHASPRCVRVSARQLTRTPCAGVASKVKTERLDLGGRGKKNKMEFRQCSPSFSHFFFLFFCFVSAVSG